MNFAHFGFELFVVGFDLEFALILPEFFLVFLNLYVEVFNYLLFVVEAIVEASDRSEVLIEAFDELLFAARVLCLKLAENFIVFLMKVTDLFAEFWQGSEVALATFDLFVLNDAVKAFFSTPQSVSEVEVAVGNKSKFV